MGSSSRKRKGPSSSTKATTTATTSSRSTRSSTRAATTASTESSPAKPSAAKKQKKTPAATKSTSPKQKKTAPKKQKKTPATTTESATTKPKPAVGKKPKKMFKKKKSSLSGIDDYDAKKMFREICDDEDNSVIPMEGICTMGEKLGIDALEDIRILVLLWKMKGSEKPGQMSENEWMQGCASLKVDSWQQMKDDVVPTLDTGFLEQSEFKDFYKFCFQFNLQGTHKTLDKDMVVALLNMVLGSSGRITEERLTTFGEFLEKNDGNPRVTLDQWTSFLDFCVEYPDQTFAGYDESTSAWPVLIDEYIEYMEEKAK